MQPMKQGLLEKPIIVPNSNIEIIRPYDGTKIKAALFDFDGTLSLERDGWPNLMVVGNSSVLVQACSIPVDEAVSWVISDMEATIGLPTIVQMERLKVEIEKRGGKALSEWTYKDI